jgi:hypothetical protein
LAGAFAARDFEVPDFAAGFGVLVVFVVAFFVVGFGLDGAADFFAGTTFFDAAVRAVDFAGFAVAAFVAFAGAPGRFAAACLGAAPRTGDFLVAAAGAFRAPVDLPVAFAIGRSLRSLRCPGRAKRGSLRSRGGQKQWPSSGQPPGPRCGFPGDRAELARASRSAPAAAGPSTPSMRMRFVRDDAPLTSETAPSFTPSVRARRAHVASFARPSVGGAATRSFSAAP